jgi:hypothetical protein
MKKMILLFSLRTFDNLQKNSASMANNLATYVYVWLDKDINKHRIQQQLRHVINHLQVFDKIAECDNYIRASTREKLVFVMSDAFNESTIARLHDLPQLIYCYVICVDNTNDIAWTNQYPKVSYELTNMFTNSSSYFIIRPCDRIDTNELYGEILKM